MSFWQRSCDKTTCSLPWWWFDLSPRKQGIIYSEDFIVLAPDAAQNKSVSGVLWVRQLSTSGPGYLPWRWNWMGGRLQSQRKTVVIRCFSPPLRHIQSLIFRVKIQLEAQQVKMNACAFLSWGHLLHLESSLETFCFWTWPHLLVIFYGIPLSFLHQWELGNCLQILQNFCFVLSEFENRKIYKLPWDLGGWRLCSNTRLCCRCCTKRGIAWPSFSCWCLLGLWLPAQWSGWEVPHQTATTGLLRKCKNVKKRNGRNLSAEQLKGTTCKKQGQNAHTCIYCTISSVLSQNVSDSSEICSVHHLEKWQKFLLILTVVVFCAPALVGHDVPVVSQARAALLVWLLRGCRQLAVRRQRQHLLAHCE